MNQMHSRLFPWPLPSIVTAPAAGVILVAALIIGCEKSDRLRTYPVSGTVTFPNGSPIGLSSIFFESREHSITATGVVEEDGTFALGTYEEADGAVAGKHIVAITPMPPEDFDPDANRRVPPPIDPSYKHPDRSGLEFEVTEEGPNHFEIQVKKRR